MGVRAWSSLSRVARGPGGPPYPAFLEELAPSLQTEQHCLSEGLAERQDSSNASWSEKGRTNQ